jgi:polar amino acid transport system substrate-binding protein
MRHFGQRLFLISLCILFSMSLKAKDVYRIQILSEENLPLQFTRDGETTGFAVDVVEAILDRTELNGRVEIMPWARAYKMAQELPNVLLFSTRRTLKREHSFKWASQVFIHGLMPSYELSRMQSNMVLICHVSSNLMINSVDQAQQHVIATQRGDYLTEYLIDTLHWPTNKMLLTRDFDDTIRMLEARRVNLAMMISQDYEDIMRQRGFDVSQFKPCLEIIKPVAHLYFSFSLGTDDKLVEIFKDALESMYQQGSYQQLYDKWYLGLPNVASGLAVVAEKQLTP